ncbi:Response regulator receiver domain-containing protein [Belnapia rosea]|nr:Response regulator receiver domain-containing protein [Belnapia rosea]
MVDHEWTRDSAQPRQLRVLVAEDEALIGMAVAYELEQRGHVVTMAGDGQKALELVAQFGAFDALVTDMQMPRLRGDELARQMRARFPDMPIVVMSANHVPEATMALEALGSPITILTKPTPFGHLADELERLERERLR